jgi:hypothetical protein
MTNLKNIKIDENIHRQLKTFCSSKGLKVGKFVELIIMSSIKEEENNDEESSFGNLQNNEQD